MIELIQELIELLSREGITIVDVIRKVGVVSNDPGGLMPIEVNPNVHGVKTASLSRDPDTGQPYELTIEPTSEAKLTTAMLQQAFGDYRRLRTDRGQPPQIIFYPKAKDTGWKVAILASLQSTAGALEDQQVSSLSLRRDQSS
jgi:hypothetical protein